MEGIQSPELVPGLPAAAVVVTVRSGSASLISMCGGSSDCISSRLVKPGKGGSSLTGCLMYVVAIANRTDKALRRSFIMKPLHHRRRRVVRVRVTLRKNESLAIYFHARLTDSMDAGQGGVGSAVDRNCQSQECSPRKGLLLHRGPS